MIVRIRDISDSGLTIDSTLDLEALQARLGSGRTCGAVFSEAPRAVLHVDRTMYGAEVSGRIEVNYIQDCSRCLEGLPKQVSLAVALTLRTVNPREAKKPEEEFDTDSGGVIAIEGDSVDLEEALQEILILSLTLYWHPPIRSDGSCTGCKKVITFEATPGETSPPKRTLGDLFAKARSEPKLKKKKLN